jgi:hypothetical protein
MMKASAHTQYAAFVGIDRVDGKHDVCLQQAGCDTREFSVPRPIDLKRRGSPPRRWVQKSSNRPRRPTSGRRLGL